MLLRYGWFDGLRGFFGFCEVGWMSRVVYFFFVYFYCIFMMLNYLLFWLVMLVWVEKCGVRYSICVVSLVENSGKYWCLYLYDFGLIWYIFVRNWNVFKVVFDCLKGFFYVEFFSICSWVLGLLEVRGESLVMLWWIKFRDELIWWSWGDDD